MGLRIYSSYLQYLLIVIWGLSIFLPSGRAVAADGLAGHELAMLQAQFRKCGLEDHSFTFSVIPSPQAQQELLPDQITWLRSKFQEDLQKIPGARLKPIEEFATLAEFSTGGQRTDGELRDFLKTSRDLDVIALFSPFGSRAGRKARISIKLITTDGTCGVVANALFSLPRSRARELRVVFDSFARRLVGSKRGGRYRILRFRYRGSTQSDCDLFLRDELAQAILANCTGSLTGESCPKVHADAHFSSALHNESDQPSSSDEEVIVTGEYSVEHDATGERFWVSLRADVGGLQIEQSSRNAVIMPDCDTTPIDLVEQMRNIAPIDTRRLEIRGKSRFRDNEAFILKIFSETSAVLYCWYLYEDGNAYILTPTRNTQADKQLSFNVERRFPEDFHLAQQRVTAPARDLFQCFLPRSDISAEPIHEAWLKNWGPAGSGPKKQLKEDEWRPLIEAMARVPEVISHAIKIVVEN